MKKVVIVIVIACVAFQLFFRYQYLHTSGLAVVRIDRLTRASCYLGFGPESPSSCAYVASKPTSEPAPEENPDSYYAIDTSTKVTGNDVVHTEWRLSGPHTSTDCELIRRENSINLASTESVTCEKMPKNKAHAMNYGCVLPNGKGSCPDDPMRAGKPPKLLPLPPGAVPIGPPPGMIPVCSVSNVKGCTGPANGLPPGYTEYYPKNNSL